MSGLISSSERRWRKRLIDAVIISRLADLSPSGPGESELPRLNAQPSAGSHEHLEDRSGVSCGDLLDLDAAVGLTISTAARSIGR
jgi:hypothetical protein